MTSETATAPEKAAPIPQLDHKNVMDHLDVLPQVRGYRILLIPVSTEKHTAGGIILPDAVTEKQRNHAQVFRVVGVGSNAYKDPDRFPSGPYCELGDFVLLGRYAGTGITTSYCEDLRVVTDDEIIAVVPNVNTTVTLV
mgnify:CR=1 FL=1